jgi:O-antigen/teichoic acid export membrane protein
MGYLAKLSPKSDYFKHVVTLISGTAVSQAIIVLASPILTRMYAPSDFGILGTYVGLIAILGVLATGQYEFAILLPKKDEEAINIVALCLILIFIVTILLGSFSFFAPIFLKGKLSNSYNREILYFVPIGILFICISTVLTVWLNRVKAYKMLAFSRVFQSGSRVALNIIFGLTHWVNNGLVWGYTFGFALGNIVLTFIVLGNNRKILKLISIREILKQAKNHINFPKFTITSNLIQITTINMPLLVFPVAFGATVSGFYVLTQRVTKIPLNLIAKSVGNVYRQKASQTFAEEGTCKEIFLSTFKHLLAISIVPFGILYLIAPDFFAFIFGEQWRISGEYTRILVVSYWFQFIVNPLSHTLLIAGKQKINLIIQVINFVAVSAAIYIGFRYGNILLALVLIVCANCMKYLAQFVLSYYYCENI